MMLGGEIRSDEGDGYSSGVLKFIAKFPAPYPFMLYRQPVVSFLPSTRPKVYWHCYCTMHIDMQLMFSLP
jgi:hypothetical protein